ncbi:MAG: hypothetical protein ACRENI_03350 [Gemmatimonadaceae bacterium]
MPVPDNAVYYQAAYMAAAVLYAGYAASVWWRSRRARARVQAAEAAEATNAAHAAHPGAGSHP